MSRPGPDGALTAAQLRAAVDIVLAGDPQSDPEVRYLLDVAADSRDALWALGGHGGLVLGIRTGFELVRRYGLLGVHPAGITVPPQQILVEAAHRYGLHLAWVSRREFEEFLGDDEPMPLTDQQWMALDDRFDDFCDTTDGTDYIRGILERAGWSRGDNGRWHAPGSSRILIWKDADNDEPGDQNADTLLVEHGYWSLGPDRDGEWSIELVVQDERLEELPGSGVRLPNYSSETEAKAAAQQYEDGGTWHAPGSK